MPEFKQYIMFGHDRITGRFKYIICAGRTACDAAQWGAEICKFIEGMDVEWDEVRHPTQQELDDKKALTNEAIERLEAGVRRWEQRQKERV